MTTITFDLPDQLTNDLQAKAAAWKMSLEGVLQEAAIQLIFNDESQLEPADLIPEEAVAAQADFMEGRTVSHQDAMAHFRKALVR